MRPPECAVCGDEFEASDGRLVTFAERESDRQWRERAAASAMVGHPPNVEWFCGRHAAAAAALVDRAIDVALSVLAEAEAPLEPNPSAAPDPRPELVTIAIAPTDIERVRSLMTALLPDLVGEPYSAPSTTSRRSWSPMDGAQPPYCPYDDVDVTTVVGPVATAVLTWDRAMWNDDDPARLTVQLWVTPATGDDYSVSATVGAGFEGSTGMSATRLLLIGEPGPVLQRLIAELATPSATTPGRT